MIGVVDLDIQELNNKLTMKILNIKKSIDNILSYIPSNYSEDLIFESAICSILSNGDFEIRVDFYYENTNFSGSLFYGKLNTYRNSYSLVKLFTLSGNDEITEYESEEDFISGVEKYLNSNFIKNILTEMKEISSNTKEGKND